MDPVKSRMPGASSVFAKSIKRRLAKFRALSQKFNLSIVRSNGSRHSKKTRIFREMEEAVFNGSFIRSRKPLAKLTQVRIKEFIYYLLESGEYEKADLILPRESKYPPIRHLRVMIAYRLGIDTKFLIDMLQENIEAYKQLDDAGKKRKKLRKTWAVDLQLWGIALAVDGLYKEALEKYNESYKILRTPATLYNIFCCYCRMNDESLASKALLRLGSDFDLSQYDDLLQKLDFDMACDVFRRKRWFLAFVRRYSGTANVHSSRRSEQEALVM